MWLYFGLIASCMASGLPGEKQAIVLRAMLSDGFSDKTLSPSVKEFMRFHFAPYSTSLPVHALILEHTLDRANPDLLAKVMALTGYEAPKAIRVIQVWFRFCIDKGECDKVDGKRMMLRSRAVRSYTEMILAAFPPFAPIDTSKMATSGIEDLAKFASYEKIFAVPDWMFRLMEFHVASPLVKVAELIYASSLEYSIDEIWTILKIWRQFCLLERQKGLGFFCYMGDAKIWHLDEDATIPVIMHDLRHNREFFAPLQAPLQATVEYLKMASGRAPDLFASPAIDALLSAMPESTNTQTVSLKRLSDDFEREELADNEKRRKSSHVKRQTPTKVTLVETSSSSSSSASMSLPSAPSSMEIAFLSSSPAFMEDGLLAAWKDAYEVAETDMDIVWYLINAMLLEPQWSPTDPETAQYNIYQHLKSPLVATPEFVALLQTHQELSVTELAKLITEREPVSELTYRNVKRTMFCIIIWRRFGNGPILNDRNNYHLNRRMLFAYLTVLGRHILPSTTD